MDRADVRVLSLGEAVNTPARQYARGMNATPHSRIKGKGGSVEPPCPALQPFSITIPVTVMMVVVVVMMMVTAPVMVMMVVVMILGHLNTIARSRFLNRLRSCLGVDGSQHRPSIRDWIQKITERPRLESSASIGSGW